MAKPKILLATGFRIVDLLQQGSCDAQFVPNTWSPEQLKMMYFGGNNRAQVFFKQHGWTDGGKIEAKYTSRAADLYRQLLTKEVAKSNAEESVSLSSSVTSQSTPAVNGLPDVKITDTPKDDSLEKHEPPEIVRSPKAPSQPFLSSTIKKPIGAKKTGTRTGGLGVRKLTTKPNESLYDQKPEEPVPVLTSTSTSNSTTVSGSSFSSRFEYVENVQSAETTSGGVQVINHVLPPKASNFFADFGMDGGFQKKPSSSSSKMQVEESNEARQKFSNAKSISSAQFFGDQSMGAEKDAQVSLQKYSNSSAISSADLFGHDVDNSGLDLTAADLINRIQFQATQDLSSLKNIAGETGKKLTSLASSLITDLQDRIL
ncbi:GTPase-activating protein 8 [Asimina triloba]